MKELLDQSCLPLGDVLLVLLTKSGTKEDDYVDMDMCIRLRDGPDLWRKSWMRGQKPVFIVALKVPQRQLKHAGIPLMVVSPLGNRLEKMQCFSVVI